MSASQPIVPSSPIVQLTIREQRLGQIQINGIYYDVKVIGEQDLESSGDAFNQTMSKICAIAQTVLAGQQDITRVDINESKATLYKEKSVVYFEFDMSQTINLDNLRKSTFRASTERFTDAKNWSQSIQTTEKCSAVFRSIFPSSAVAAGSSSSSSSSSRSSSSSSSSSGSSGAGGGTAQPAQAQPASPQAVAGGGASSSSSESQAAAPVAATAADEAASSGASSSSSSSSSSSAASAALQPPEPEQAVPQAVAVAAAGADSGSPSSSSPVPPQKSLPEELSLTIPKPLRPITPIDCVSYPSLATSFQKNHRVCGPGLSQQRGYIATPLELVIETRRPSVRTLSDQQPDVDPEAPARIPVKIAGKIFLSLFGHSFDPLPTNFQPPRQDANALAAATLLATGQRQ